MWTAFLIVEGILMLLTVNKLLLYRKEMNQTITVLARDSFVYFVIVFACMASILATDAKGSVVVSMIQIPTQCITSIAVGRMMMNLRGLILDDPEHTTHLQTLQFAGRTHSGSDIEEI
ncbi:hypothetical protein PILCRDRAFT_828121 [Piloderma croceum F 1598]|uniref:Uncharacterized protein n=1 Tax=Piloderma croceum (strain F 1598) TaxID=765440 RepID=A0A0C3F3Q2_PILCF|nr:hypothetical protein PILCRDRAFT_828121 [Piloderma croceum F 1598]